MDIPQSAQWILRESGFVLTEQLPSGYCAHIFANETQVLKVPFQGEEMTTGCQFLVHLSQFGCTPKIELADFDTGCLLMTRVLPGKKLHEAGLTESEQLEIWAKFVQQIKSATTEPMPKLIPLAEFCEDPDDLAHHLLDTSNPDHDVLLHGDLHHENILLNEGQWVMIDAKGVFGDRAFEGAAFMRNPIPFSGEFSREFMEDRLFRIAEILEVDPFRVWGWTVVTVRGAGLERESVWFPVLKKLYEIAPCVQAERFVQPLA